jgi:trigger factor
VAGKTADFLVTVKKIEAANLPEVNEEFAKSLGMADGTVEALRADIKKNLEREVKFRVLARNKQAVMDALVSKAELDLPKACVQAEVARLLEGARADLKQRGIKDADKAPIPEDIFRPRPSAACAWAWWWPSWCAPTTCKPSRADQGPHRRAGRQLREARRRGALVLRRPQALAEVEAVVIENNVTEFVLGKAKVTDKAVSFDELMGQA